MGQGVNLLRREQRRAAGDFLWDGSALPRMGMHDWFAEEFVLSQRRVLSYVSVCSGVEAATVAWHPLGWKPLAFAEIDSFPSRVLAHYYPGVFNVGDFTKPAWDLLEGEADVLVGGTPCQAFSVAGLRKSLADDRGNLTLEFIRVADALQPSFVVWENVPGVLSTRDNAFGCFLAGLVGADSPLLPPSKRGRWPDAGLVAGPKRRAAWRVLDAQYFGLAQRRKRVFVVACPGDGADPAEILFEPEGVQRHSPPRREEGEGPARGVEISLGYGKFSDLASTLDTRAKDGPMRNQTGTAIFYPLDLRNATRDPEKHGHQNRQGCGIVGALAAEPGMKQTTYICFQSSQSGVRLQDVHATLDSNNGPRRHNGVIHPHGAIRRLTPRECERLQGFPDDYTAIPGAADSPRYKALGNSMAVPVMRWIGERIDRVVNR